MNEIRDPIHFVDQPGSVGEGSNSVGAEQVQNLPPQEMSGTMVPEAPWNISYQPLTEPFVISKFTQEWMIRQRFLLDEQMIRQEHMYGLSQMAARARDQRTTAKKRERVELGINNEEQICEFFINKIESKALRVLAKVRRLRLRCFFCKDQGRMPGVYELAWSEGKIVFAADTLDEKTFSKVLSRIDIGFDPRNGQRKEAICKLLGFLLERAEWCELIRCGGLVRGESNDCIAWRINIDDACSYVKVKEEIIYVS